jgi:hypothetical protein
MFPANILPGQGFIPFTVYRKKDTVTASGRAVPGKYQLTIDQFYGIVVNANQQEVDQWKQNGHPITHKVIQYGGGVEAKVTDYLKAGNGGEFYVQGLKNPGGLNVTRIYYVEERFDLKKVVE